MGVLLLGGAAIVTLDTAGDQGSVADGARSTATVTPASADEVSDTAPATTAPATTAPATTAPATTAPATTAPATTAPATTAPATTAPAQTSEPVLVEGLAPSVDPEDLEVAAPAEELVEPYVSTQAEILAEPESLDQDAASTVASDGVLGALNALAAEYEANGWTQVGRPDVASTELLSIDQDSTPVTATLQACLDYAQVDVVDGAGESVTDPNAPTRVLNVFQMEFQDGRWVMVDRTFPAETTC